MHEGRLKTQPESEVSTEHERDTSLIEFSPKIKRILRDARLNIRPENTCVCMCVCVFVLTRFVTSCHFPELLCVHMRSKSIIIAVTRQRRKRGLRIPETHLLNQVPLVWSSVITFLRFVFPQTFPYPLHRLCCCCCVCFSSEKVLVHLGSRRHTPRFLYPLYHQQFVCPCVIANISFLTSIFTFQFS